MKHNIRIVSMLVILFLIAQVVGMLLVMHDVQVTVAPTGDVNITHTDTVIGPRPEVSGMDSFIMVIIAVLIGTGLLLFLIKIGRFGLWKVMFFLAVFMTISIALGVLINPLIAIIFGFILAILKIYKRNILLHNFTEILIYSGIALLFVPIFTIEWIIALLLVISVYDFIAVFKSKHMISIAQAQTSTNLFAGLSIPYTVKDKALKAKDKVANTVKGASITKKVKEKEEVVEAILGGGDIAFPLIFAGVVMESLIQVNRFPKFDAFLHALIIPIVTALFLLLLFVKGKQGKYYPAMPVLTAGCLIGLLLVWLI